MDHRKKSGSSKRKVYVEDSSDEDFEVRKKHKAKDKDVQKEPIPTKPSKLSTKVKKGEVSVKSLQPISPASMFGSGPIKKYFKPIPKDSAKTAGVQMTNKTNENGTAKTKTTAQSPSKSSAASASSSKSEMESLPEPPTPKVSKTKRESTPPPTKTKLEYLPESPTVRQTSPRKPKTPIREVTPPPAKLSKRSSIFKIQSPVKPEPKSPPKQSSMKKERSSTNIVESTHSSSPRVKIEADTTSKKKKDEFKKPPTEVVTPIRDKKARSSSTSVPKKSAEKTPDKPKKDESAASTPELTPEEKKRKQQSAYFKHLSRGGPKNLGSKEIPVGAPDCFKGFTFVLTGVLDSLEREDVVNIVTQHGGRVTGSVSRKTTHLIVGDEPGESKTKKAKDLKIPLISEDDLLEMLRKSNPDQPPSQTEFGCQSDEEAVSDVEMKQIVDTPEKVATTFSTPSKDSGIGSSQSQSITTPELFSTPAVPKISLRKEAEDAKMKPKQKQEGPGVSSLMWVDKYKPATLKNIVGQVGEKSNAQKLLKWLQNWFKYHGKSGEKVKASWPGLKDPDGKSFKAALLSGCPGIGKTSTAHLVCKEVGYDFFEMNASDTRNKRGLHEIAADSLTSKSILQIGSQNQLTSKHVLIMDEVDGMSGNEDRGGIQELIALIKTSKVPIICICNDRNHQKIRSLANYCFDLRFCKPNNVQLKAFIQSVCFKEKLRLPVESVQQLINSTDHDIRQVLNQLELLKESNSTDSLCNPRKDLKFGPWDVCRKVFSATGHVGMSIHDKNNLFFQDYSFGPLFVQENYLKWTPLKAMGNKYKTLDRVKLAAEAIATGDLIDNIIRRSNNWSLLPTQAVFSSILPGEYMEGNEVSGIEFPRWLGKNSNRGKMSRLLQQLHTHVHLEVSGSLEALNMDYLPYLRGSIVNPLVEGDIHSAVNAMQAYSLMREDLDNINELALWPGSRNPMEKLDSKAKSAFTRQLNKELHVPYSVIKVTKGRGRSVAGTAEDAEGLEDDEMNEEEEEDDEDNDKVESDAMIKVRKKASTTTKTSKGTEEEDEEHEKPSTSKSSSSKRKVPPDSSSRKKRK